MSNETEGRNYCPPGRDVSGYLGVSPEYMTYANETEKPILTDTEKWNFTDQLNHLEGNIDEDFEPEEGENPDEDGDILGTGEDENPEDPPKGPEPVTPTPSALFGNN